MPVRPRRQRRGIPPLTMTDFVTLDLGPTWIGVLIDRERDRLTLLLRQHPAEFDASSWGVRHLLDGEPLPMPALVGDTLDAIGCPSTTQTLPPA